MNDLDREKLIDYVLGRMSPEESRTFEKDVDSDPALASAVSALQDELVNISSHADVNRVLDDALRRRLAGVSSDASSSESTRDSSSAEDGSALNAAKSRAKKFRFIPKRVVAPRREETALIFKRASVLADEERSRRLLKSPRSARMRRRSYSGGYRLANATLNPDLNFAFPASSFDDGIPWLSADAELLENEEAFGVPAVAFESETLCVEPDGAWASGLTTKVVPPKSDASPTVCYGAEKFPNATVEARLVEPNAAKSCFSFESGGEADVLSRFSLNPLAYVHGGANSATRFRRVAPYLFDEFQGDSAVNGRNSQLSGVARRRGALTREEVLEEIAAIFGQNARILQSPGVYLAVSGDVADEEENGPTLSAEDLRLAELLGHTPSAIERNEYYWEEEGSENAAINSVAKLSLPTRIFLIATAPPAFVGRVALRMFRGIESKSVEYSERGAGISRSHDGPEPGRLIDVTIPLIAGVALAVGVVFPLLKYVATEIFVTVAESKVRKLSGNLTVSPHDPELDVIPFISEQILFPHYEAVEFGDEASRGEMESDGYPMAPAE